VHIQYINKGILKQKKKKKKKLGDVK
jgi:hypothetical protein